LKKDFHPTSRSTPSEENPSQASRSRRFGPPQLFAFVILFLVWIVFSGRFDGFHIVMGLISSAVVAAFSGDLLFPSRRFRGIFILWLRWIAYIPWLVYQIFLANLRVMVLIFHPKMKKRINPKIIRFESKLKSGYARTTFANSITLTPGTITVNVTALGRFSVHCIDDKSAQSLPGEMEERILKVFRE
jgi:multicomponent Na+:H+ antiporter subunit E